MKKCEGCGEVPKRIPAKRITHWISEIGYEILDDIIAPTCKISDIIADLNLATISSYADKQEEKTVINKIKRKYKIDDYCWNEETPIASIALYVLMEGKY
jgi:hypothetical protein